MVFSETTNDSHANPKVSVLVPCYNVEKYLEQCLSSLVKQKLKDIEIICINDGSTDGTLDIINKFAAEDERIIVIDKPNSGYGAAMNIGLQKARGEYIGITESDDFASPKKFYTLYKRAVEYGCDIVKANFYEHENDCDIFHETFAGFRYKKVFDPADQPRIMLTVPSIWAAIYKLSMIKTHGIAFNETPGASFQDTSFVLKSWFSAQKVFLEKRAFLHYRIDNPDSSVKSTTKIYAVCEEYESVLSFVRKNSDRKEKFIGALSAQMFNTYRWNYNRVANEYHNDLAIRMRNDFIAIKDNQELKKSYFTEENWEFLQELLTNAEQFAARYVKGF